MTTKPQPPSRDQALLWTPPNRTLGLSMAISGAAFIASMAYPRATGQHSLSWLAIALIALGGIIAWTGLRMLLRKVPVIAADDRGLFVSVMGWDRSLLPWEEVADARIVGAGGGAELVILGRDAQSPHVHASLRRITQARNRQHGCTGLVYISRRGIGMPADQVVREIRELLKAADGPDSLKTGASPAAMDPAG